MIGLAGLPRTGQYHQAIDFILEHDETFTYANEDYQRALEKCGNNRYSEEYKNSQKICMKFRKLLISG